MDLASIRPEQCDIPTLGRRLAQINRYCGASAYPYSVAAHSVLVSYLCAPAHALGGLVHDAAEAYVGDLITPIKAFLPDYWRAECAVQQQLRDTHDWPHETPEVRAADQRAYELECAHLLGFNLPGSHGPTQHEASVVDAFVREWQWRGARDLWIARYFSLHGGL